VHSPLAHLDSTPALAAPRSSSELDPIDALSLTLAAGDRFERLGAIVQEHLYTRGKKLRARLALQAARAMEVDEAQAVVWATACELLHNATLIHDDLEDRDEMRRGMYAVWVRHGDAQAINAGDLMLMLPFIALEHASIADALRWQLARAIARRAEDTVRGQSLEMTLLSSCRWSWDCYVEAAVGKTSAMFALPVHGAALLGGKSPEQAKHMGDVFRDLGLLFQMQDDVLDLFGDKGHERGADIRQGRASALVIAHLTLYPDEIEWLGPILGKARRETTDADVALVAARFEQRGALQGVLARIEEVRARFLRSPELAEVPLLARAAEELVERCLDPIHHLRGEKS
jgi:geranylgeranyl diphosphate synthase type I